MSRSPVQEVLHITHTLWFQKLILNLNRPKDQILKFWSRWRKKKNRNSPNMYELEEEFLRVWKLLNCSINFMPFIEFEYLSLCHHSATGPYEEDERTPHPHTISSKPISASFHLHLELPSDLRFMRDICIYLTYFNACCPILRSLIWPPQYLANSRSHQAPRYAVFFILLLLPCCPPRVARQTDAVQGLPFSGFRNFIYIQFVRLHLTRNQPVAKLRLTRASNKNTEKPHTNMHAPSGIRIYNHSVWVVEDVG